MEWYIAMLGALCSMTYLFLGGITHELLSMHDRYDDVDCVVLACLWPLLAAAWAFWLVVTAGPRLVRYVKLRDASRLPKMRVVVR